MKKIYLLVTFISIFVALLHSQASDALDMVRHMISNRLYDEAFFQVNHIITDYPNSFESFEARILLAELHLKRNLFLEARMQLMILLRNPFQLTTSQRCRTYYNLGLTFFYEQSYELAVESFEKLFQDFPNTTEAISAIPYYFDSFFFLKDYQSVIVKSRELLPLFTSAEMQAELLYQQSLAYYTGNMYQQANRYIEDIKSRYSHTMAAWKTTELQVLIHFKERGRQSAIKMLENLLSETQSRYIEERLAWLLVQYYIEEGQSSEAKDLVNFVLNKFNLSENLSAYHLAWLKMMVADKDIRIILDRDDFIKRTSIDKPEYNEIIYYLAKTYTLAQDYWKARELLDENIETLKLLAESSQTDLTELLFECYLLYADILILQGQFVNGIEQYNFLLNSYGFLGRNYEILIKLGDIYLLNYHQEGIALNFYRQAIILAKTIDQVAHSMLLSALCLEALGQYSEALYTLKQIPLENISDNRQRLEIENKINLLHIFFCVDVQNALSNYFKKGISTDSQLSSIDYTTILAVELKQFEDALDILRSGMTYEIRMQKIKIYLLFAYKNILLGNNTEANAYSQLVENETRQLRGNIAQDDSYMISCFQDFLDNRGKINPRNTQQALAFINSTPVNKSGIDFRNFFRFQLFIHFNETANMDQMIQIAQNILPDSFVSSFDYQLVQVTLANHYYQNQMFAEAINTFARAERFMTLAHPKYFYQYAMSLYNHQDSRGKALEILQKLVLNNIQNDDFSDAKNLILVQWIDSNRLQDALDILNQIPPLSRTDDDFRYFVSIYNKQSKHREEKEALLYIKNKNIDEYQRLATLHFLTNDKVMAEYTWKEILENSNLPEHSLNAYASLGNMNYLDAKYREAILFYEEYFKHHNTFVDTNGLIFLPDIVAKELIISYYLTDDRLKAEATHRTLSGFINRYPEILAEISLYEGIFFTKTDHRRAMRPLTQVIEDVNTPSEIAYKAMYYRALGFLQDARLDNAERDLISALNTQDEYLGNQVRLSLGNFYHSRGNFHDALELYYEIITRDLDGSIAKDAAHNFALTAKHLQDWDIAIAAYKIIIDRWGQSHLDPETMLTIGFSFFQGKQFDQAHLLLKQILPELPTNDLKAEAQYWIAESFAGKLEFDTAITEFQNLKINYPRENRWTDLSDLKIAEMCYQKGDTDTSRSLFREIVRVHGANSDLGKEATKYLDMLSAP